MVKKIMKIKVNFTLRYGLPVFSKIPDIIEKAEIAAIDIKFSAGGWEAAENDICYHEWKSMEDELKITEFLNEQYGNSIQSLEVTELTETSAA